MQSNPYELVRYEWTHESLSLNGFESNFVRIMEYLIERHGIPDKVSRSKLNGNVILPKL
jgi:hypothetical protein